ncbi:hypothetical protein DL546_009327 [Coniochaeta pulveracea]|uniref:Major facilitator superfamily (MFS) profile domain-containing protein n=1 Tax=Coniochaeta pulveracea TaxID=177199 RepID=A0A420YNS3_9PEZI|nr:hypothetical protein DL546_009327 [Coniochaeta pulveracea]
MTTSEPPPDGGYGWVCTVAAAIINMHSWGISSAYAVFLSHYLKENTFPGTTSLEYAFVGSLSIGCLFLISPITTIATRRYGIRPTMFAGALCEAVSLVCASFASRIWHIVLTQGILFGFGLGLLFIPTAAVIPQWFTSKRSLASGVAVSGAAIGGAVYSLATGALIRTLGLAWTFRILGIIAFVVNTGCVVVIRDRNTAVGSNQSAFHITLFRRIEYCLVIAFSVLTMLGYFILVFSLASYANHIGLNSSEASVSSAVFNLGQAAGRPLAGYLSDRLGRINIAASMTLVAGVLPLGLWVASRSYGVLIIFAVIEGIFAGTFWATIGPIMAEVIGLQDATAGLSLMWLTLVIPSIFSEPVALSIVGGTGSYLGTELFTGFMYIAAAVCLWLLRGWKIGHGAETSTPALIEASGDSANDSVVAGKSDISVTASRTGMDLTGSSSISYFRCCCMLAKV